MKFTQQLSCRSTIPDFIIINPEVLKMKKVEGTDTPCFAAEANRY
jgi:hypothetical protein